MIKLEHIVTASPEQMEFIIEGMRNPMNSWDKSDSLFNLEMGKDVGGNEHLGGTGLNGLGYWAPKEADINKKHYIGPNDLSLMQKLSAAGTDHRKFMRMMPVYIRITAPLYWWKEFDTYKVGTVRNSCSTMHKIQEKEFTLDDFSCEHLFDNSEHNEFFKDHLLDIIDGLNQARLLYLNGRKTNNTFTTTKDKEFWWQMIQLLPSSYNQTANVMLNYETLANIYHSRKEHKLDEWREFCKMIKNLPYSELITGEPVPIEICEKVVEYCNNDVIATEAVFHYLSKV